MVIRSLLRPHRWTAPAVIVLMLLANMFIGVLPSAAANYTVTWEPGRNLTNSTIKSVFPSVVVDNNNKTHIVYSTDVVGSQDLLYMNNVNGSFSAPQLILKGVGTDRNPFFTLALGPNNTLHLVYSWLNNDKQIYYRQAAIAGATANWSLAQRISDSSAKAVAPSLFVDSSGNAHITWADQRCNGTTYNVFYRVRLANGTLQGSSPLLSNCQTGQGKPRVVVTNDGKVHAVLTSGGEIYHAQLESNGWSNHNISESPGINSDTPAIVTDGVAIYIAWDEGVNGHDIRFRRSVDGGISWSNIIPFSDSPAYAAFPSATYSAITRRVYVVWQDQINTGAGQDEIWYREFDPADGTTTEAKRLSNIPGVSALPVIGTGPNQAALVWHDRTTGILQIFYAGGTIAGGCSGTLLLEGGAAATKNPTVAGVVTPSNCTPDQMQVTVDVPPTSATPKVSYSSNISVAIPATSTCAHTVYVQLYANGATGQPAQDSIKVDTTVNATVQSLNPHMADLPTTYTPPSINDTSDQNGASDGDPNYTRDHAFFINIADIGDCVGLDGFDATGSISSKVTNGTFMNVIPLPGDFSVGPKMFDVVVSDTLDNVGTFPTDVTMFKLTYDPADTDPSSTVTNTSGLPVLAAGGSVVGDSATNSIIRVLTFSAISVNDNLYGQQGEGLPSGKQFWGVWVANSRLDNAENNPAVKWFPVHIATPDAAFAIQWSIFSGLDYGADPTRDGTYYVYVRFLDGAGNPSAGFLKTTLTLDPGYALPTVNLPLVSR